MSTKTSERRSAGQQTQVRAQGQLPHHVSSQPGMHPDDQPETTGERLAPPPGRTPLSGVATPLTLPSIPSRATGSQGPGSDVGYEGYTARLPTSTRRYQGQSAPVTAPPRTIIRVTHHGSHEVPPRARATAPQAPSRLPETEPRRAGHHTPKPLPRSGVRRQQAEQGHCLTWIGVGAVTLLLSGALLTQVVVPWGAGVLDDWHYGTPRTVQLDGVVGGDSARQPTHFIATNVGGHVSVIEMHASDPNRTSVIVLPVLTDARVPPQLSLRDVNHDHAPDLLIWVHGTLYTYLNDGHGHFRPLKYGEHIDV